MSPEDDSPFATNSYGIGGEAQMEKLPSTETIERVLLTTDHRDFREALAADLFDLIPVAGDITNAARIAHAWSKRDYFEVAAQVGDLPGPLNLLPANIVCYLRREYWKK